MMVDINLPEAEENKYAMLGYLAQRGQLLEQLQGFDELWKKFLEQPLQSDRLRLLRIDLRKLRSTLKILEPLLPSESKQWLGFLKSTADGLGNIREYDVALKGCEKYSTDQLMEENADSDLCRELPGLKALLLQVRKEKTEAWLRNVSPDGIGVSLQTLLELLKKDGELSLEEEALANAFLQARLQSWGMKLCNKLKNEVEQDDLEKLHSLRIKIKRFRYAYEVYMAEEADAQLLAALKNVQDILGSIHDGECDIAILEGLTTAFQEEQLTREFNDFKTWRLAKNGQRLENLPVLRSQLLQALEANIEGARLL